MNTILLGKKFRKIRGKRSINEFARLCKISPKTIRNLENDKTDPNIQTILKIAVGLNLTFAELIELISK